MPLVPGAPCVEVGGARISGHGNIPCMYSICYSYDAICHSHPLPPYFARALCDIHTEPWLTSFPFVPCNPLSPGGPGSPWRDWDGD